MIVLNREHGVFNAKKVVFKEAFSGISNFISERVNFDIPLFLLRNKIENIDPIASNFIKLVSLNILENDFVLNLVPTLREPITRCFSIKSGDFIIIKDHCIVDAVSDIAMYYDPSENDFQYYRPNLIKCSITTLEDKLFINEITCFENMLKQILKATDIFSFCDINDVCTIYPINAVKKIVIKKIENI